MLISAMHCMKWPYSCYVHFNIVMNKRNRAISTFFTVHLNINSPSFQGKLKEKDFDIRKAAGGVSFKAVERSYIAPVANNFLEIHFFWAGKGVCCVPAQGFYGSLISAIKVSPFGMNSHF